MNRSQQGRIQTLTAIRDLRERQLEQASEDLAYVLNEQVSGDE